MMSGFIVTVCFLGPVFNKTTKNTLLTRRKSVRIRMMEERTSERQQIITKTQLTSPAFFCAFDDLSFQMSASVVAASIFPIGMLLLGEIFRTG